LVATNFIVGAAQPKRREDRVDAKPPEHVHLVGSVGLDSAQDVFRTVGRAFGRRLRCVPDGEPGPRRLWVSFHCPLLRSSPFLRPDPSGAVRKMSGFPLLCLAAGLDPADVSFGALGYAREARASYLDFCAARERGELPSEARFQVCLPTPMGVICAAFGVYRTQEANLLDFRSRKTGALLSGVWPTGP
jgi:hypothetical protein